ncbi:hypothetical protein GCM10027072_45890 [Streptomyces bullii]
MICEVSDAGTTAPHLRRARAFDDGGRGLLRVAQLTQGWGTRHTTNVKTIWCAQTLPETEPALGSESDASDGMLLAGRCRHQPVGRPARNEVSRSAMSRSSRAE